MIEQLSVRNVALIQSLALEFGAQFTALSGETGAGKSMILGALSFLCGQKVGPDLIRKDENEAWVSAVFRCDHAPRAVHTWLAERSIEPEHHRVLLRRVMRRTGRGTAWIQNVPVSRADLEFFTSFFIDLHGQHEHQSLFRVAEHRRFLDTYGGLQQEVDAFTACYAALAERRAQLQRLASCEHNRQERLEFLSFALEELEHAALDVHEERALEGEEQKLCQHEKLCDVMQRVDAAIRGVDLQEGALLSSLKKALGALESACGIDGSLEPARARLESAYYEIEDVAHVLRTYTDGIQFCPDRLQHVQERLALIYRLKKKYGGTVAQVLEYRARAQQEMQDLSQAVGDKEALEQDVQRLMAQVLHAGRALSLKRHAVAEAFRTRVEGVLHRLGMASTRFHVQICTRDEQCAKQRTGPYGFDDVEFLISANAGEPVRPLAKIASGGELSRVMLALKTVLSSVDEVGTLIFDEIDVGIGGETARAVAEHLQALSEHKQVVCITHLAMIAAHADAHVCVKKESSGEHTNTSAAHVVGERRVQEVARMLAGDTHSATSLAHAQELLRAGARQRRGECGD
ncbi:DNA repair protein RecN [Treponema pallidum subsp. endemicum str. Bosnia A]|uniref:DNA repair protein RecN n=1 Tax=Treponema pallidum subsp. endemicum str. Bosnia A TaxID=1155776 RepID=A0AAU8S5A5_TREPL|nr:DNA repair protein RecN [Treponema pallidum]AJB40462.1 DNA repair protein RecN [Treponema pallidum subsp. endemicum str. Bosnia A]